MKQQRSKPPRKQLQSRRHHLSKGLSKGCVDWRIPFFARVNPLELTSTKSTASPIRCMHTFLASAPTISIPQKMAKPSTRLFPIPKDQK
jgi:hypothetical protein